MVPNIAGYLIRRLASLICVPRWICVAPDMGEFLAHLVTDQPTENANSNDLVGCVS